MNIDNEVKQLILLFNNVFGKRYNVCLMSVSDEPFYSPSSLSGKSNQIFFANGYFSSALHEIAHWVIAGSKRRLLPDYGYWYEEDGRSQQQQQLFEQLEIYPQAIEKAFSEAAGRSFNASVDNLNSPVSNGRLRTFEANIEARKLQLQQQGFPPRAQLFINALSNKFNYAKEMAP